MINKENSLCMDKICRSCMLENIHMRSVYEVNTDSVQLAQMIMACTTVQVNTGDGLPNLICQKCEEQLNIAYLFKQQCEKTDVTLREYTNHALPNNIKEESLDIVVKPDLDVLDIYSADGNAPDDDDDDEIDNANDAASESDVSNYSETIRRKKKGPKSRQCRFCNKTLTTKEGLKLHERRHTGEKLKHCPVCQSQFAKTNHLIRHMQLHNKPTDEYKHTCDECGMGFTKSSHLHKHKREHKKNAAGTETKEKDGEELQEIKSEVESEPETLGPKLRPKKVLPIVDRIHPCKVCNKLLTTAAGLQIHMRRHTGNNLSTCYICMKSFTKTSHLNRHMLTHGVTPDKNASKEKNMEPKEKKYMACEFCDRKFVYRKSFLHHIQLEHQISEDSDTPLSEYATIVTKSKRNNVTENGSGENASNQQSDDAFGGGEGADGGEDLNEFLQDEEAKKIHVCHVCNHKFTRANHLTRHMTLHRAVLLHKCDRCEKAFMTPEHLATHVQEYHVDRPYVCSLCNKPFSRGEHLIRHLKVHDKDGNGTAEGTTDEHKCSICEKVFSRSDHLARHTKLHLAQDKRHVCSECGKAFNRLDNLRTHARIHTGVRDPQRLHLCIYCGKEFNNSSNMIVHMRRHTGERPYKCAQCGKGFPRSHDLKCHERTHSGEKPYLCTLCGKSFNKSNKLLRHTRVHTGERPYVCNLCGRAFTQSNDLALHMRRHTGSRPYACGMCPARFIQSGQLKAHRRSQGHWLETPPDLKGAHRVTPVTPLVNPPPIKFKTRVQRIKEEPTILGHTVGLTVAADIKNSVTTAEALLATFKQQPHHELKVEDAHKFTIANLSRDALVVPGSVTPTSVSSASVSMDNSLSERHHQQQHQQHQQHRPITSSAPGQYQPSVSTVEPGTSFANNLTVTSTTYSVVSEGYTYQSYG